MSMEIRATWTGAGALTKIERSMGTALESAAEVLLAEANKDVPHREGTLEGSGDISVDPRGQQATVFYDTPYAVRLHEHPEYHFRKGRKGKWLEDAFNENEQKLLGYLQSELANALKG